MTNTQLQYLAAVKSKICSAIESLNVLSAELYRDDTVGLDINDFIVNDHSIALEHSIDDLAAFFSRWGFQVIEDINDKIKS